MPKPTCPAYLVPLLDLFEENGEHAYPVGGCVRDTLMGRVPHDWDVAVTTAPDRTESLCAAAGYRTIPTGVKHGTVTVLVPHSGDPADRAGSYELIECTTCRTEGGYSDGRHPDAVSFTGRIRDDLSRRDFTVNAMAFAPTDGGLALLDLFGGEEDLHDHVIRCVGDPDTRFSEDALRLLRAVRFAVQLDFVIEPATYAAVARKAEGLARISRERVRDELEKILMSRSPERGVALLDESGLLPYVLPRGISPDGTGRLSDLPADFSLRLAALLRGMDGDAAHANLDSLRLSNATRKDVLTLLSSTELSVKTTPRAAREWRRRLGTLARPALLVRRAHAADAADRAEADILASLVRESEEAGDPVAISELAIGGRDLAELGVPAGKGMQEILSALLELVLDDPTQNTREALTNAVLSRQN